MKNSMAVLESLKRILRDPKRAAGTKVLDAMETIGEYEEQERLLSQRQFEHRGTEACPILGRHSE